jgi:hypothetical protein
MIRTGESRAQAQLSPAASYTYAIGPERARVLEVQDWSAFGLRLQPELDQAAHGLWPIDCRIMLFSDPFVDLLELRAAEDESRQGQISSYLTIGRPLPRRAAFFSATQRN